MLPYIYTNNALWKTLMLVTKICLTPEDIQDVQEG